MLPWQPNKTAADQKTHKLGRQSSTDHKCEIWFTLLHWLWRKYKFNPFPITSLWELSVAMATKPTGRTPQF